MSCSRKNINIVIVKRLGRKASEKGKQMTQHLGSKSNTKMHVGCDSAVCQPENVTLRKKKFLTGETSREPE